MFRCWHLWCLNTDRRQQGLSRDIRLPDLVGTRQRLTIIQSIMQLERSYSRHLKCWNIRFTSCVSALDLLTPSWEPAVKTSRPQCFNELSLRVDNVQISCHPYSASKLIWNNRVGFWKIVCLFSALLTTEAKQYWMIFIVVFYSGLSCMKILSKS